MNKEDIKEQFIFLINQLREHQETDACKDKRYCAVAITDLEAASMWAVSSCFSEEERNQH